MKIEDYLWMRNKAEKLSQKLTAALPAVDILETWRWLIGEPDLWANFSSTRVDQAIKRILPKTKQN